MHRAFVILLNLVMHGGTCRENDLGGFRGLLHRLRVVWHGTNARTELLERGKGTPYPWLSKYKKIAAEANRPNVLKKMRESTCNEHDFDFMRSSIVLLS
jgi:hypothetical protein